MAGPRRTGKSQGPVRANKVRSALMCGLLRVVYVRRRAMLIDRCIGRSRNALARSQDAAEGAIGTGGRAPRPEMKRKRRGRQYDKASGQNNNRKKNERTNERTKNKKSAACVAERAAGASHLLVALGGVGCSVGNGRASVIPPIGNGFLAYMGYEAAANRWTDPNRSNATID